MNTYAKLFSSIVHSTIWRESNHVRLVWITMLAISDRHGQVAASVPGLADVSRVTVEECEDALARLEAPDPHSRSKEFEGRRIAPMDGGWLVLNYVKHRDAIDSEVTREQTRLRVRKLRETRKSVTPDVTPTVTVTPGNDIRSDQINSSQLTSPSTDNGNGLAAVGREPVAVASQTTAAVRMVFEHWQAVMGKPGSKLTGDRERRIKARLREGYTVDDLKAAVDGCKASAWHQGANKDGRVYDDLELICRDGKHVEDFKGTATPEPEPRPKQGPAPWERYQ